MVEKFFHFIKKLKIDRKVSAYTETKRSQSVFELEFIASCVSSKKVVLARLRKHFKVLPSNSQIVTTYNLVVINLTNGKLSST